MTKEVVIAPGAPEAIGPYSVAVKANGIVYCSGMLGLDPITNEFAGAFEGQCRQAFRNVCTVLEAAGCTRDDIVRQSIYVTDMKNFNIINKVMQEFFKPPYPARSCMEVCGLPRGGLIEIEATALQRK